MIGQTIKDGFIDFDRIDYYCPHCNKLLWDDDEKLLDRCNKNKSGWTKVKCECGNRYGFTYNYKGEAVAFKLEEDQLKQQLNK